MKTFLITVLLFIQSELCAQNIIPIYNGTYAYHEVIKADSISTKDALFSKAQLYIKRTNKLPEETVVLEDKGLGRIISKGLLNIQDNYDNLVYYVLYRWEVYYTKEIFVQDGQYEITLSNFTIKQFSKSNTQKIYLQSNLDLDQAIHASQKGSAKKLYSRFLNNLSSMLLNEMKTMQSGISKTNE